MRISDMSFAFFVLPTKAEAKKIGYGQSNHSGITEVMGPYGVLFAARHATVQSSEGPVDTVEVGVCMSTQYVSDDSDWCPSLFAHARILADGVRDGQYILRNDTVCDKNGRRVRRENETTLGV